MASTYLTYSYDHLKRFCWDCYGMFGDIKEHLSTFLQELRESPKSEGLSASTRTAKKKVLPKPIVSKTVLRSTLTPWRKCLICAGTSDWIR